MTSPAGLAAEAGSTTRLGPRRLGRTSGHGRSRPDSPALSWFGRLPGDIRFSSGNTHVYVPITSCVILSVLLTIVLSIYRR